MDVSNELAVGIDVGGTNTKYGVVNHRGEILQKGELKTEDYPDVEKFIQALYTKLFPVIIFSLLKANVQFCTLHISMPHQHQLKSKP